MTPLLQPAPRAPRGGDASVPAAPGGAPRFAEHPWHRDHFAGSDGSVWSGSPFEGGRRLRVCVVGGHPRVTISRPKQTTRPVRIFVLEAFLGPRPPDMLPCHLDGDTLNCAAANLSWAERLPGAGQLVDLDQCAAIVKLREEDMLPLLGEMPPPAVLGVGGKPSLWDWPSVRPWLERTFACRLPVTFPAW